MEVGISCVKNVSQKENITITQDTLIKGVSILLWNYGNGMEGYYGNELQGIPGASEGDPTPGFP